MRADSSTANSVNIVHPIRTRFVGFRAECHEQRLRASIYHLKMTLVFESNIKVRNYPLR
jgi:hypothetical protein